MPETKQAPETLEMIADRIAYKYLDSTFGSAKLKSDILAALRNERERCARVADRWANAQSCEIHSSDPCCHVRTGARIAEVIRKGE